VSVQDNPDEYVTFMVETRERLARVEEKIKAISKTLNHISSTLKNIDDRLDSLEREGIKMSLYWKILFTLPVAIALILSIIAYIKSLGL